MKWLVILLQIMLFGIIICLASPAAESIKGNLSSNGLINRIDGIVWDPNRRPVSDVYVELQDELYRTLNRVRTSSSGRFSFTVARQGNYIIKVLTTGTNYLEHTEAVEIVQITQTSADNVYLDIYLKLDKRKINSGVNGVTEAVFVQEVPDEARKLYNSGTKALGNNDIKGLEKIEAALKIFPDYYDALNTLGREYVQRKEYEKSFPYLIKAIDINQRSYSSFYTLGYAAYQLNHIPEALKAAEAATILQPNSINALLLYGTVLRLDGNYEKAQKTLLQANNFSKNYPIPEIHWQLALTYNKLGRNKEAADELETYLKIRPDADNKKEIKDLIAKLRKEVK
jgi:tetratricopeptide (TPR) repeat protein